MPPVWNAVKSVIHAADSFQFLLPKTKQEIIHVVYCSSVKSAIWLQLLVWNKVIHELSLRASQLSCAHCICPNMLLTLLPLTETTKAWEQELLIHIVFFGHGIQVSWLKFLPWFFNALIENKLRSRVRQNVSWWRRQNLALTISELPALEPILASVLPW